MAIRSGSRTVRAKGAAFLTAGTALFISGCASQDGGSSSESGPISAYESTRAQSNDPKALRPVSVEHQGALTPASGIANAIAGNTLVVVQPLVGLDAYKLQENPIYFRSDGLADSPAWVNARWNVDSADNLCLEGQGNAYCYEAFTDDAGQAYLMRQSDRLLTKVASIETGDSRNVKETYERNLRAKQEKAAFEGFLVGAAFKVLFGGEFGGGGGGGTQMTCPDGSIAVSGDCFSNRDSTPSAPEYTTYTPAVDGPGSIHGSGPQHGTREACEGVTC